MTSSLHRQLITIGIPVALLALGTCLTWFGSQPASPALLILAILAAHRSGGHEPTLWVALTATVCLAAGFLVTAELSDLGQSLWFISLWAATGLLIWHPEFAKPGPNELEQALEDGPTGVLITDPTGRIVSVNETMAATLQTQKNTLVGSHLESQLDGLLWQLIHQNAGMLAAGEAVETDFEWGAGDSRRTFHAHGRLTRDRLDKGPRYLIQVTDRTPERIMQDEVNQTNAQLRKVLSHSFEAIFVLNRKLSITFVNHTAAAISDLEPSALIGRPFYDLVLPEDRRLLMKSLEALNDPHREEFSIGALTFGRFKQTQTATRLIKIQSAQGPIYAVICTVDSADKRNATVAAETRFSQIFHCNPDAIMVLRATDGVIVDINEGFTHLLGYTREDAIGETERSLLNWANRAKRTALVQQLERDREVIDQVTSFRTKSGDPVNVEFSLRYIEIDGELSLLCLGRNINTRLSAEAALVENEEIFKKVFTQSPDGILLIRHVDGAITDVNDAFIRRSGYDRNTYIGQRFVDFLPDDAKPDFQGLIHALHHNDIYANQEIAFINRDGSRLPSLISGAVLEIRDKLYTMVIAKDIGKQRATEDRLRRSEQRFRAIFENTPVGILLVDTRGRIFQANHTAATLLAYDEQQLNGLHVSQIVPLSDRPGLKQLLKRLSSSASPLEKSERKLICQNDIEIWANVNVLLQRDRKNQPSYFIIQFADITDIKHSQARMEQMAFYDTLTKLANRRLFHDRLTQAIEATTRHSRSAALLYLDLDNFKRVNDTLGHEAGDFLLREVADRLRSCVRKEDTVSRSGGDEFTILLNEISSPSDAGLMAQKILNHLREPIILDGHPLVITTSIGITTLNGDGTDANLLMRNADLAMYKAKERGRNNYQFYSRDLNQDAIQRLRTEYEIRQAFEQNQFELYFQPKISLTTMQIVGVESLIRWNHPDRGVLGPEEFIKIAEDTDIIIDIGSWVIEQACRAAQILNAGANHPFKIAINISPRQFRDPNLATTLKRSLQEMQLDPSTIEVEITEAMLMYDLEAAEITVNRFANLGVNLAIDDFGTGYSSLSYLKRFRINTVKVDRSFVSGLPENSDDLAIARAVIAMAHQLNMKVVAEGVETPQQLQCLTEAHCEYAQGYLFSKPIPLQETRALLSRAPSLAYAGRALAQT